MSRWVKETGFLSEEGEGAVMDFKIALNRLLLQPEVQAMGEGELRTLSCVLHNLVGNIMSNHMRAEKLAAGPFDSMTDAQFDKYLQDKYGAEWMLKAMQPDELRRAMKQASMIDLMKEKLGSELIPMPQHGVVFPKRGPTYK